MSVDTVETAGKRAGRMAPGAGRHARRGRPLRVEPRECDVFRVGLLIPASGAAGLWGPSCLACATLAAEEWNAAGGHRGREVSLTVVDASDECAALEDEVAQLVDDAQVEAFVSMSTSSARERITDTLDGRVPFVYTPLYEGGALPHGVMAIGETPENQLLPALLRLTERHAVRRWYFVGNDYVWPRRSHALASAALGRVAGTSVVGTRYVPLGHCDVERLIDEIRRSRAEAVLMSLVGQDAIEFNRAFGDCGLAGRVLRLSCAVEENGLLAMGAEHNDGLFVASGYFAALENDANGAFRERYWSRFGERAPVLNALGQSTYEGVSFLRSWIARTRTGAAPLRFSSVRGTSWIDNLRKHTPVYLAEADGLLLRVIERLQPTSGRLPGA